MVDMDSNLKRNDLQHLVYGNLSGSATVNNLTKKFDFKIEGFYAKVRYLMTVEIEKEKLKISVSDADFAMKKEIIGNFDWLILTIFWLI
mgnify:CR=1 FL=1